MGVSKPSGVASFKKVYRFGVLAGCAVADQGIASFPPVSVGHCMWDVVAIGAQSPFGKSRLLLQQVF
jgi:hypothetical protein